MPAGADGMADLAGTIARDPAASERLVRRLMPIVEAQLRASLRRLGVHVVGVAIADLSQDVWVGLLKDDGRRLRAYDPSRGASLETYVALLTRREAIDWARGRRALKRGAGAAEETTCSEAEAPAPEASPEANVIARDLARALDAELMRVLPTKGQLVYRYLYRDGMDTATVARTLKVTQQVVYNWQHSIRGVARDVLARAGQG